MKGRKSGQILYLLLIGLVSISFVLFGKRTWSFWNIPTIQPDFIDLRIITAGSESFAQGYNPDLENPQHPNQRPFNLPQIWHLLFFTGIDQSDTLWLAGILIFSFAIGLWIFLQHLEWPAACIVALSAFTPPTMLAVERGNLDLFLFLMLSVALWIFTRSQQFTAGLIALAAMLKIYPIFGVPVFLQSEKIKFFKLSLTAVIIYGLYAILTLDNLRLVFSNTEKGFELSYGAGVIGLYVLQASGQQWMFAAATALSYLAAFALLFWALYQVNRRGEILFAIKPFSLNAFRLGAGIYLGTFLLGANWDYRLMFLLFTFPQLLEWSKSQPSVRIILGAALISLVYLWASMLLPFAFYLDEIANWTLFTGLLYLLLASGPDWLREEIQNFFARYTREPAISV